MILHCRAVSNLRLGSSQLKMINKEGMIGDKLINEEEDDKEQCLDVSRNGILVDITTISQIKDLAVVISINRKKASKNYIIWCLGNDRTELFGRFTEAS